MADENNKKGDNANDQLKDLARAQGEKLGFLIASLDISEETREAFLNMLPEMSVEQIDRLIDILEAKYIDEQTKDIDEQFKKDLRSIRTQYNEQVSKADEEALKDLEELENSLSQS